ncbi:MAG TPA: methyltransferase domain-containing protein [Anaerolineales bacterium]|nr:methyltransferase domain-containing protein [Anaerolineales bacterium]
MAIDVNSPDKWEADYQRQTDGWDLRGPTPALKRLAESGRFPPGRMLVPCAGRGHDAREFARNGFSVTAVDFSPFAAQEMRRLAEPGAPVEVLQHDMFELPHSLDGAFDYVLQYTCFCAIDPQRRADYADLVTRLLKPGGCYIDLAFPLDGRGGGPPFATSAAEIHALFESRGFELISEEKLPDSVSPRREAEALLVFQKNSVQSR